MFRETVWKRETVRKRKKAMGVINRRGRGNTRGKNWENKQRSLERESRISGKWVKEEYRAGGKMLTVFNGNLHAGVSVLDCRCWCHVPLVSISLFCCSKTPFSTDPFIHNIAALWSHTHIHTQIQSPFSFPFSLKLPPTPTHPTLSLRGCVLWLTFQPSHLIYPALLT